MNSDIGIINHPIWALWVGPPSKTKDGSNPFHFILSLSLILTMPLRPIPTKRFRKLHRLLSNSANSKASSRMTALEEDTAVFCGESASTLSSMSLLHLPFPRYRLLFSLRRLSSSKHRCLRWWVCHERGSGQTPQISLLQTIEAPSAVPSDCCPTYSPRYTEPLWRPSRSQLFCSSSVPLYKSHQTSEYFMRFVNPNEKFPRSAAIRSLWWGRSATSVSLSSINKNFWRSPP